jgi:hypothetical protein
MSSSHCIVWLVDLIGSSKRVIRRILTLGRQSGKVGSSGRVVVIRGSSDMAARFGGAQGHQGSLKPRILRHPPGSKWKIMKVSGASDSVICSQNISQGSSSQQISSDAFALMNLDNQSTDSNIPSSLFVTTSSSSSGLTSSVSSSLSPVVNMGKYKFPFPKRGIGRVGVEEEALSSVWDFFQYNPISDRSQCNFCGYLLAGKNCTNLRVHLKSKHTDLFEFDPLMFNPGT